MMAWFQARLPPTPAVWDHTSVRDAARPRITGMTRSSGRQAKLGAIGCCEAPWLLHGLLHSGAQASVR